VKYDPKNKDQAIEIKDIRWFSYYDVLDNIREFNQERKHIFKKVHFFLKKTFIDNYK
jgi:NADH pyrophosphatase NudC (nudix superfamily)